MKCYFLQQLVYQNCDNLCMQYCATYVTYSNLILLQNVIETYVSGIQFCSTRRVEHYGAIGFQNKARMSEIKYFLVRERDGPVQRPVIPSQAVAHYRGRADTRGRDCSLLKFFLTKNCDTSFHLRKNVKHLIVLNPTWY